MPRALAIVHQADAGPGVFGVEARERGWELDDWLISSGAEGPSDITGYEAVFTFGGAIHPDQEDDFPWIREEKDVLARLISAGVPTLGACLGSQLLADAAGAPARRAEKPEIGWFDVEVTAEGERDPVIGPLAPRFEAFQWHSYRSPLPGGAVALAENATGLQAYRIGDRAWGIQFHAEVAETDAMSWAVNYAIDPDAVRIGIEADRLSAEIEERIGAWNLLGRELCGRFLEVATER